MDTLTQIVLGAAVGQVTARKRLGRAALAIGAVGGLIPDLDVFAVGGLGPLAEWQYHRGITHSLFFGPVVGPALGYGLWAALKRWRPQSKLAAPMALGPIIAVLTLALVTHPLLDLFTVYGTQLLAPFSNARFSISAVSIIDPVYTLLLVAALVIGLLPRAERGAHVAAAVALTLSSAYVFYGWSQNQQAEALARRQLAAEGVRVADIRAYTTIFQPWLRRLVVHEPDGVRIGFVSTWAPDDIAWTCVQRPPHDAALDAALDTEHARVLAWFADGQVWPELRRDEAGRRVVRLTDLRYGAPGSTLAGLWGVDVTLAPEGQVVDARRIAVPRAAVSGAAIAAVYRAGYGDIAGLYEAVDALMPIRVAGRAPAACTTPS